MTPSPLRTRLAASLAALAFTPLAALAAGSASVNYGGESGQIYWQDKGTVRVDMAPAAGEGYALPKGKHGLLRIGDGMIVESLDRNTPAASIFELPSEPVNFGGMMKRLMEQATQQ